MSSANMDQYNIYDRPRFESNDKDTSSSWAPYGRGGEEETDFGLEEPPHYDEINFQGLPRNENHYQINEECEHNGSAEKMLDKSTLQCSDVL